MLVYGVPPLEVTLNARCSSYAFRREGCMTAGEEPPDAGVTVPGCAGYHTVTAVHVRGV
jgi:hypothetical protein